MKHVVAKERLGTIGEGGGLGHLGKPYTDGTTALIDTSKIVSTIIGVMTVAAVIWFIFTFITGAFSWITSKGDKAKLETARDRITNAVIGLIIVVAAWAIVSLLGVMLGWENILIQDPGALMDQLDIN